MQISHLSLVYFPSRFARTFFARNRGEGERGRGGEGERGRGGEGERRGGVWSEWRDKNELRTL